MNEATTNVSVGPAVAAGSPQAIAEVVALTRRLRLPYLRRAADEVIATARAQRWDPAEVLRVLLAEEATGRDEATTAMRRKKANFPAGKTFDVWDETRCSIPPPTQQALRTLEWVDRHENLCVCGPSGTGKSHLCEALGQAAIDAGRTVAWFGIDELGALVRRHRADDSITKAIRRITRVDLIVVDDIGMLPVGEDAAEGLTASWTPATRNVPWPSHRIYIRPDSTNSCPRPWPPRPSTGSCTTRISASPKAIRSASPKPPPARG